MIKILLRLVGAALVVGSVAAAWMGFEAVEAVRGLEAEIYVQHSQKARGLKTADGKIAESEEGIEKKKAERNLWCGAAAGALVVGLVLALLPSSRKRKRTAPAAEPAPAPNPDAQGL